MHTDGSKVKDDSFKSMVVAQFTGISLQKDPNAYWQPHNPTGKVYTSGSPVNPDTITNIAGNPESATNRGAIFADPDAEYKHSWRHFHIKASNGAFIQVVSVFAVGYADQFLAVNGGDMSITNSNSNFGQISLRAAGHKFKADPPSAYGKITAVIPPAGIASESQYTELYTIATKDTWEANLGVNATKSKPDWEVARGRFSTAGNTLFKLYIDIPGVQSEEDIPELVVETVDQTTGTTLIKRFLTYGSSNNYNLFRDYYNESGVLASSNCIITNQVDSDTGGVSTYNAVVQVSHDNNSTNGQRIGYFWDSQRQKIYLNLDSGVSSTTSYVEDFVFASTFETEFVTETVTNNDGSTTVVSSTKEVEVLRYWNGFPGLITTAKLIDSRASNPDDLLWRVKYVIPKDYRNASGEQITPKPPEKRFIIRGTSLKNDGEGIPYANYSFTIWDVKEIQTWERDQRDGEYYLTILRADIDKLVDVEGAYGSATVNNPYIITRKDAYADIKSDTLSEFAFDDKNYRTSSNVNYLYPSTNEEGNITNPRVLWNPPQADSRVVVEKLGGGARAKDVTVPNKTYYKSSQPSVTPFYDVPSMASITAEAVHRLVYALDLVYLLDKPNLAGSSVTGTNVKVAPVTTWDYRGSQAAFEDISTSFNVYGSGGNGYRYGSGVTVVTSTVSNDINTYGINNSEEFRKIPVGLKGKIANLTSAESDSDTVYDVAPVVPLLRPSILRASSHTWEYVGIGPGNYSTGFPNLQTRVLKAYEQFISQGYENSGGFVASSGTNSAGDFYIGNQVIQAGGQSTTTLNVPKVRKSSESNAVDFSDIENRIANSVINVIPSANKSSAQQNLLKGLSNFFTTARLTVSDTANIQTLSVTDRLFIANNSILNGEKFPEGGPEGYGFTKGARPEKTGFIATDTNDRLYVSPKFLDAWRIKKKILSATNINLDNNRIYIEPLSRTFISSLTNNSTNSIALSSPITFTGNINTSGVISNISDTSSLYVGMRVAEVNSGSRIVGEATIISIPNITTIELSSGPIYTTAGSPVSFVAVDRLNLLDTSGIPPFGRIDIEMALDQVNSEDYILDGGIKYYLSPTINISLQYDAVDYTNNTVSIQSTQNLSPYENYILSVLPKKTDRNLHSIIRNYPSVLPVITNDDELTDSKYLKGTITQSVASNIVTEAGINTLTVPITVSSTFYNNLPNRGAVTLRSSSVGLYRYSTYIFYKSPTANQIYLLRKVETQSNNDSGHTYVNTNEIYFTGCKTYASYGDKWTVENAFIPDVEEITEDVDIESATLYTLPEKPVPYTGIVDIGYTDSNVPNPVTSKAFGANLQTKRVVKSFQPFENLKQVADFSKDQGFTANDEIELIMKPGYYRLYQESDSQYDSIIEFPCKLKINGSGTIKTNEEYSKELANAPAGRIGGYSLDTVKSGDSVNFFRSPRIRNNHSGRTDLLYIENINDTIYSTGGIDISNVHFLGLNEAITRNEILDNAYSSDPATVTARRKVRKAWYVKQSAGFPVSEAGFSGALSFQATYNTASTNSCKFTYTQKTSEFTGPSNPYSINAVTVDGGYRSIDARYLKITFTASDFSNIQRYNWITQYVIPGTTLYYIPALSNQVVTTSTKRTKVLDVRKNITNNTITSFDIIVGLYDPTDNNSAKDEDMDLIDYPSKDEDMDLIDYPSLADLSDGIQCVFVNRDGDEFVTLVYNWCKEKRNELLPKSYTVSGEGYDEDEYDIPRVYGIVAGYKANTINIVVDTHPSAEIGGIRSFTRTGAAPTGVDVSSSSPLVASTLTGTGSGASFNISVSNNTYSITVSVAGVGYKIGDTLEILGSDIHDALELDDVVPIPPDITFTVGSITANKKQYPAYGLFNYYPSIAIKLANGHTEDYSFTIPTFPNGFRRLFGRQDTRYYLLEVDAAVIGTISDNRGHNDSVINQFTSFGYESIDFSGTLGDNNTIPDSLANYGVTLKVSDLRRTTFVSDEQFEAVAKYNLNRSSGYKESGSGLSTLGKVLFLNYSQYYKINRKKFPTGVAPSVGNIGSTLIKVSGIPGTTNLIKLTDVTIGALSDANDLSNTYGGAYHGGIISVENGQINLSGVRFRGNLSLDWSGILTNKSSRLDSTNKFSYGHSVDLIETSGIIKFSRFGNNAFTRLNASKEDVNFQYYTQFSRNNNLYLEPNRLPTGKAVDYDSRTFPITTIQQISKFDGSGNWNQQVTLDEKYLSDGIIYSNTTGASIGGSNLRFNNSAQVPILVGVAGGHSDSTRNLETETITFTRPYSTGTEQDNSNLLARNIYPNYTKIIRNGNPDSVLATVTNFEYYKTGSIAYFVIEYSGTIQYESQNDTTTTGFDYSGFELQLLTNYIPSAQRYNYVSTLTTRYIKKSNVDGTKYSKYELGFDQAQNKSIFANNKDISILKKGSGIPNISRASGSNPNIITFTNTRSGNQDFKVILETNATGDVLSCDIVSIGFDNFANDILVYQGGGGNTTNYYEITMQETTKTRVSASEGVPTVDYDMFEPGEVVGILENSCFVVNNFIETSLTGIKAALQKVKSIITPGNYIEYGGQYYKIASNQPGRPYLAIYQYANPSNIDDIRTSLVVRLEEKTYNIAYTRTRNDETITRFDLYEDDNLLRYWPNSGRLEIGELELCDFTKTYVSKNIGYRITLSRSNSKFWPSYIHDWDGLEILETFTAGDSPTSPAEAAPQISVGNLTVTELRLADPVDITCSTYKKVSKIGYETLSSPYITKTGIQTTQRAYIDITSDATQIDADFNKFEIGQIVSLPWRNLGLGWHRRGSTTPYDYSPSNLTVTVDTPKGVKGVSGSSNRAGDNKISVIITNSRPATTDIVNYTDTTDGISRLTRNLNQTHQFFNATNTWTSDSTSHDIFTKIDPLCVCRSTTSIDRILGKPHDDNNSISVTITEGNRVFTLTRGGNTNVGIGLVPNIVVKSSVLPKDTRISRITFSGDTYTITLNQTPTGAYTGPVTFTNELYLDLEVFHPVISDFPEGYQFKIAPSFNEEGDSWRTHNEIFMSRIVDIGKVSNNVRLYLADPFTSGNSDHTGSITHADSRYNGFISINHGGYSFPRSGGSYFPSNVVRSTPNSNELSVPNNSGRIRAGDLIRYTYEANSVIQEMLISTRQDMTQRSRFRLRNIAVEEGDALVGFADNIVVNNGGTPLYKYGVEDIFREDGSYTVTHKKYINRAGTLTDNYLFGSSARNSFYDTTAGEFAGELSPITSYIKDGTTYYVDIGGGGAVDGSQTYSGKTGTDLDNDATLGVYNTSTLEQNSTDPWTESLVLTNGGGKDAQLQLTVSGNEVTGVTILNGGTGYNINDFIRIRGAVFNFNNPRYPSDLYLYVSDVNDGVITSFDPRLVLTNVNNQTVQTYDVYQVFYNPELNRWVIGQDPSTSEDDSDTGSTGTISITTLADIETIYVDEVIGDQVYLKATSPNAEGDIIDYNVEFVGGFQAGQKLIFSKPKPSSNLVTGTVLDVSPVESGYSTLTIDSPDNIIYDTYPVKSDWLSISDILVSHSSDLFANDGPLTVRFMHSESGGSLEFDEFGVWNDWYANGSSVPNKGYGMYGSHGWVGNWGRTINGARPTGLTSTGPLNINWTRQRANSIWKVAQPIRPAWTHRGLTTDPVYNGAAFMPSMKYFWTNGTATFFNNVWTSYNMEDQQSMYQFCYGNVMKHTSNTIDSINLTLNTSGQVMHDLWYGGRFLEGGMGPLSYQPHQWSSTFDSLSSSRIVVKNKISYQLQDLRFRKDTWGNINWGSGNNARLVEQMVADYIQHYSIGPIDPSVIIDTGVNVILDPISGYWENRIIRTDASAQSAPATNSNRNVRTGVVTTTPIAGKTYIIKTSTNPDYPNGSAWVAPSNALPSNVTQLYIYDTKICRGDAIYLSHDGGTTKTFVGYVRGVGGNGSAEASPSVIYLSQPIPSTPSDFSTGDSRLYYVRPKGLKYTEFENAYSQLGTAAVSLAGENVVSADAPGALNFNTSIVIQKRNYNTSPILNTLGDVKPMGNRHWHHASDYAYKSIRSQMGDLSAMNWSLMNINITRFNPKVHLESSLTVTSSPSSIEVSNVYI